MTVPALFKVQNSRDGATQSARQGEGRGRAGVGAAAQQWAKKAPQTRTRSVSGDTYPYERPRVGVRMNDGKRAAKRYTRQRPNSVQLQWSQQQQNSNKNNHKQAFRLTWHR